MRLTIEKTEAGYSVSTGEAGSNGLTAEQAMVRAVNLIAQLTVTKTEPSIPACLLCHSKDAPEVLRASEHYWWVKCSSAKGGCNTISGECKSKAEAIALWAGVKDDWIEHDGGDCPVSERAFVDIRFTSGKRVNNVVAGAYEWETATHYRIHKGA